MPPALLHLEKPTTTRDRIVEILLKGERTVEDLAGTLGMTRNAVRSQLALLQREKIVEARGEVKGSRRPAALFGVRAGVDVGSSLAYPVVLSELVRVLGNRMTSRQFESIMKEVGQGMAAAVPRLAGNVRERMSGAMDVLRSLGSQPEMSEEGGKIVITGNGCPISRAVEADVRSCAAMESFLSRLTGLPVKERCNHGERPSCRFEIRIPKEN